MMPIEKLNEGDIFSDPFHRPKGLSYIVMEVNRAEKMVKVQGYGAPPKCDEVGKPFWKKNTAQMFSPSWKRWDGKNQKLQPIHPVAEDRRYE